MKRQNEILVGIVTVIALVLGIFGTVWLSRGSLKNGYPLYAIFPWGAGLRQGQPVALAGVTVGYVDAVELKNNGTLFVTLRVQHQYKVPVGAKAAVQAVGFFGDQQIALLVDKPSNDSIPSNDTIPTATPGPTINDQLARVDTISRSISHMLATLNAQLVDAGGIADLRTSMASLNKFITQMTNIAAEQSQQLTATMTAARRTLSSIDSTQVDSMIRNVHQASTNFVTLTTDMQTLMKQVNAILDDAKNGSGSLQKLLKDPALFNSTQALLAHIDSILTDFQKNPRKYLKFSIF